MHDGMKVVHGCVTVLSQPPPHELSAPPLSNTAPIGQVPVPVHMHVEHVAADALSVVPPAATTSGYSPPHAGAADAPS
jgi:hypothetical protein